MEVGIRSRPAREISGDVYDFFEQGEDYTLIAFGDVSGKGAAAALYGALVSGLLRILAPRRRSPGAADQVAERIAAGAQSGGAVRHASGGAMGAGHAPSA